MTWAPQVSTGRSCFRYTVADTPAVNTGPNGAGALTLVHYDTAAARSITQAQRVLLRSRCVVRSDNEHLP